MGCLSLSSPQVTLPVEIMTKVSSEMPQEVKCNQHQLTLKEVYQRWFEDAQAIVVQKERIWKLMEENHHVLSTISELKKELKASKGDVEAMTKSICMLNSSTDDLNNILSCGK